MDKRLEWHATYSHVVEENIGMRYAFNCNSTVADCFETFAGLLNKASDQRRNSLNRNLVFQHQTVIQKLDNNQNKNITIKQIDFKKTVKKVC